MADKRWIVALVIGILILGGCGKKEQKEEPAAKEATAPSIKITEHAVNTKVKEEASKSNSGQFYYSYNKEKNTTEEEAPKTRTTIDAYLNIKSPYEKVRITLMIKRLSKDYIIKCSACHDDYANGVIGPSLLDKDGAFIYQRLQDFKTGKRKNELMRELVSQIDDAKLRALADEIANFNKEIRKMRRGK